MKGSDFYASASVAELYDWFADEAAPVSPTWERLCRWIARDGRLWPWLDALPGPKRQPNLFLGALRHLDGPSTAGPEFAAWVEQQWPSLRALILSRSTQTNEAGRCATLAPVLAGLGERIALIEVGMSAGLCLIPDRYAYRWSTPEGEITAGRSPVELGCRVTGRAPVEYSLPHVVWRGGNDLNPLDPGDGEDARWLRSLVWPGQPERENRLAQGLALAAAENIVRLRGDAVDTLPELVAQARSSVSPGATVVVTHSAVLAYLPPDRREVFVRTVRELGVRWLANEGESVLPGIGERVAPWPGEPSFVLALDGEPVARTGPHGQFLHWL